MSADRAQSTNSHDAQRDSRGVARGDVYLFEALVLLWRARWLIVTTTLTCALGAVVVVLLLPSWYTAEVLLAPAEERASIPLVGQLSGLASLAGVSVGGGNVAEAIAVLQSRELTRDFIDQHELMPVLFADQWDAATRAWKAENVDDQPDLRDGVRYFDQRVRSVSQDRRTELVRLSVEWRDPQLAATWANTLAEMVNDRMRSRVLEEAGENVEFLRNELGATSAVVLQQAIGRLLESEMEKLMLARGNKDFAFRIVDRAEVPKRRSSPRRAVIVILVTMAAGALSALYVLMRGVNNRSSAIDPLASSLGRAV